MRTFFFLTCFVIAIRVTNAGGPARNTTASVSIPNLPTNNKERVIGFEIHIQSGRIVRLNDAPIGWEICIHNDPSWNTYVTGAFAVGSTAVSPAFFKSFMLIEKDKSLGVPFDARGEIIVTEDFEGERRIKITLKDFVIGRARER